MVFRKCDKTCKSEILRELFSKFDIYYTAFTIERLLDYIMQIDNM